MSMIWLIGRAPDCHLPVDHPSVSGKHCELRKTQEGWFLRDLGSTNGTFVNGVRLTPHQLVPVRPSDQILLASIVPLPWPKEVAEVKPTVVSPAVSPEAPAASPSQQPSAGSAPEKAVPAQPQANAPAAAPPKTPGDAQNKLAPLESAGPPNNQTVAATPLAKPASEGSPRIRIGRAPDNDVVLDHPVVSRYHAQLIQQSDGWYIEDLGSFNGTAVGHVYNRVTRAKVQPQDAVFFGTLRVPVHQLLADKCHARGTVAVGTVAVDRLGGQRQPDPWVGRKAAEFVQEGNQFVLNAAGPVQGVFVNGQAVRGRLALRPGDQVQFGTQCFRIQPNGQLEQWNYRDRLVVDARDLGVRARDRWLIDGISLSLFPRELVALMGPSGAGKSTLMRCLSGHLQPTKGEVLFNGESLFQNYARFSPFLGYLPQDDIMHRELTVREALYYSARLRLPDDYSDREIFQRIETVVAQLGLEGSEDVIIGSPERQGVSGGQRKRVNLAMELLTDPLILFLDEPTSGLSSEDALIVMEVLRKLADSGKTLVVTIHQPSLEIFRRFDQLILIAKDRGNTEPGRLVYYGPAYPDAVHFFNPDGLPHVKPGTDPSPDEVLRGLGRRPAAQWAFAYQHSQYYQDFVLNRQVKSNSPNVRSAQGAGTGKPSPSFTNQTWTLIRRCFRVKIRDTYGSAILLAQAPIVALLIVLIFGKQASSNDPEEYLQGKPMTIFLTGLAALWFGCSNAAREIVGEWAIFRREWMVGLRIAPYLLSKFVVLGGLCVVQCLVLLIVISAWCNWEAAYPGMYGFILAAALSGLAIGLAVSALARTSEMALGFLPLVLIPMVILGGALVPIHKIPDAMQTVAYLMPSRWAYEGMLVYEAEAMNKDDDKDSKKNPEKNEPTKSYDLAAQHFPEKDRHKPSTCFLWLMALTGIVVACTHQILAYRLKK